MKQYSYKGPVFAFDTLITNNWEGSTMAVSPEKAKCNLAYQFKMETGRVARTRISLPGKLTCVDEGTDI